MTVKDLRTYEKLVKLANTLNVTITPLYETIQMVDIDKTFLGLFNTADDCLMFLFGMDYERSKKAKKNKSKK